MEFYKELIIFHFYGTLLKKTAKTSHNRRMMYLPKHLSEFIEKQMAKHETKIECLERLLGYEKPPLKQLDWRRLKVGQSTEFTAQKGKEWAEFKTHYNDHVKRHAAIKKFELELVEHSDSWHISLTRL